MLLHIRIAVSPFPFADMEDSNVFTEPSVVRPCAMLTTTELLVGTLAHSGVEFFTEEDLFRLVFDLELALADMRAIAVRPSPVLINEALRPALTMMLVSGFLVSYQGNDQQVYRITPYQTAAMQEFLHSRTIRIAGDAAAFRACGERLREIVAARTAGASVR